MKGRIIEIVELGQPQSLIQRENAHTTELLKTDLLIEELNKQLRLYSVVGQSEQLICNTCKSGLIDYPDIYRRTCRCGRLGYNVTD